MLERSQSYPKVRDGVKTHGAAQLVITALRRCAPIIWSREFSSLPVFDPYDRVANEIPCARKRPDQNLFVPVQ
jgi:hypothetical protein